MLEVSLSNIKSLFINGIIYMNYNWEFKISNNCLQDLGIILINIPQRVFHWLLLQIIEENRWIPSQPLHILVLSQEKRMGAAVARYFIVQSVLLSLFIDLAKLNHHSHSDDILRRFLSYLHPAWCTTVLEFLCKPLEWSAAKLFTFISYKDLLNEYLSLEWKNEE